jgi:AraC-like DNA-binding protein
MDRNIVAERRLGLASVLTADQHATVNLSTTGPLIPPDLIATLFDRMPDVVFFVKDLAGRYIAVNETLVHRCGLLRKEQLLGRHVSAVYSSDLASRYAGQDLEVLHTGRSIVDRLELHWLMRRKPGWCLTTKLPLRDTKGVIVGIIGISRDVKNVSERSGVPTSLVHALDFLEQHCERKLTPPLLARKAGLSASRFARIIHRIFGVTPGQLIAQTRISRATELLRTSPAVIGEVALDCGFSDQSAFTRAFRLATGMTPGVFRASTKS